MSIKENNFIKQVERTSKRDTYLTAIRYIEHFGLEHGLMFLKEKAASHTTYLESLPLRYDYATQSLVTKDKAIDGVLLHEALSELHGTLKDK